MKESLDQEKHVKPLLSTLIGCFKDDSWPVRDAACVSVGDFVKHFDAGEQKEELKNCMLKNLRDPIASVRQGAAVALGKFTSKYPDSLEEFKTMMLDGFEKVTDQKPTANANPRMDTRPANFGVIKEIRSSDNDGIVENQTMYSCGSLAPKMKAGGGCSASHGYTRPAEPWEIADGNVRLFAELCSSIETNDDKKSPVATQHPLEKNDMIKKLVDVTRHRGYKQSDILLETVCTNLSKICIGWGARRFKRYLDDDEFILEVLLRAFKSQVQLTSVASENTIVSLSKTIGATIFEARVKKFHNAEYDEMIHTAMLSARLQ